MSDQHQSALCQLYIIEVLELAMRNIYEKS